MMRNSAVLIVTMLTWSGVVFGQGIKFEKDLSWQQLKSKAKAENKYIFLDVMATWCGPCKVMDREVFTDPAVGEYFNDHFISVKVQTDQTGEDSEAVRDWYNDARQIAQTYSASVLPSFVFLTPDGSLAVKISGMRSATELIEDAKKAMEPSNQYSVLLDQYFAGKRDSAHVRHLLGMMEDLGRNIMAEKIKCGEFLAIQGIVKPVKVQSGIAGNWVINYPLCDFGKQPLKSAPKELGVTLGAAGIIIEKSLPGIESKVIEQLPTSGKVVSLPVKTDDRNKNMKLSNLSGFDLGLLTEVTYPGSNREVEYTVTDKWKLTESGKRLVIDRLYNMNTGSFSLKLIYDKK